MSSSNSIRSVVVTVDVGSSSVRCIAYDVTGYDQNSGPYSIVPVTSSSQKRRSVRPSSGRIILDSEQDGTAHGSSVDGLLDTIDRCVTDVLESLPKTAAAAATADSLLFQVVAVGFSTFVMNLVGVDDCGRIVGATASVSYACSHAPEVHAEVEHLQRELGEERLQWLYRKTGAPIHSAYALAQLRVWYKHNDSATEPTKARVVKWQTIASACLCRWTGVSSLPISFSEASWTGLLNIEACQYEPAMLDLLPRHCRDALPDLADFDFFTIAEAGTTFANNSLTLAGDYFDRWPALRSARLFLGIGDGACANIGSKCSIPTRIACTVGTSAAVRICLPRSIQQPREKNDDSSERLHSIMNGSVVKPGLFCYRIDRSHILVGGALTDGGSVVEWVSNLLKCPVSSVEFQQCLNEVKVLLEGDYIDQRESIAPRLPMMPFFSGERCTGFRSKATGAIAGLTLETTSAHLLKACLEGVTLRINAIAKLIVETTQQTSSPENEKDRPRIICSGKALEANILWRRMIADCTGLDVVWDEQTQEGTSRGVTVLLLAALNSGNISNAQETTLHYEEAEDVVCSDVTVPCQESERYWQEATRLQESLIDAVVPLSIYE